MRMGSKLIRRNTSNWSSWQMPMYHLGGSIWEWAGYPVINARACPSHTWAKKKANRASLATVIWAHQLMHSSCGRKSASCWWQIGRLLISILSPEGNMQATDHASFQCIMWVKAWEWIVYSWSVFFQGHRRRLIRAAWNVSFGGPGQYKQLIMADADVSFVWKHMRMSCSLLIAIFSYKQLIRAAFNVSFSVISSYGK
jgi:hypothetical protein